jgi:hypothetical protein
LRPGALFQRGIEKGRELSCQPLQRQAGAQRRTDGGGQRGQLAG